MYAKLPVSKLHAAGSPLKKKRIWQHSTEVYSAISGHGHVTASQNQPPYEHIKLQSFPWIWHSFTSLKHLYQALISRIRQGMVKLKYFPLIVLVYEKRVQGFVF